MFSEIIEDDVFRLETRRLWLRWPRISDAKTVATYASKWEVARYTAQIPHPYPPGSAKGYIYASREANALGRSLNLALTPKTESQRVIGGIDLRASGDASLEIGYSLDADYWRRGIGTEAASAMTDAGFWLSRAQVIKAFVACDNVASRRLLARIGYSEAGYAIREFPARNAMVECVGFALSRVDWLAMSERAAA